MIEANLGDWATITAPHSEVCMHLGLAGRVVIAQVLPDGVQLRDVATSQPISFPITHGEAGIRVVPITAECADCDFETPIGDPAVMGEAHAASDDSHAPVWHRNSIPLPVKCENPKDPCPESLNGRPCIDPDECVLS